MKKLAIIKQAGATFKIPVQVNDKNIAIIEMIEKCEKIIRYQKCCLLHTTPWWCSDDTHNKNIERYEKIKARLLTSLFTKDIMPVNQQEDEDALSEEKQLAWFINEHEKQMQADEKQFPLSQDHYNIFK